VPNTLDPTFCLSILCLIWISSHPQLAPVRFSNIYAGAREKACSNKAGSEKQHPSQVTALHVHHL
jgi:hypothetical protein